jgi:cytochrome c oxidase subunit 2
MSGRIKFRTAAALAGLLVVTLLLSGCVNNANMLDPKGPVALWESWLFWFIFYVATFIFVVVTGVLLVSLYRFRARPGLPAPRQTHGNTRIEIVWTVVPSLFLFAVLAGTIYTMFNIGQPTDQPAMTVKVIGHQWWWEFQYPDQGNVVTADELHIPVGQNVHIQLISNNVIHSFWVPNLAGKTDVIPGQNNTMWLRADTAGEYRGECTEYCGEQHAHMNFVVVAEAPDAFATWVSQQQAPPNAAAQGLPGAQVFAAHCAFCHLINGQKVQPSQIGPNLTHFGSRTAIAGGVLSNTHDNLIKWVTNTQAVKPGNDMPDFHNQLSQSDIADVVAYLQALK